MKHIHHHMPHFVHISVTHARRWIQDCRFWTLYTKPCYPSDMRPAILVINTVNSGRHSRSVPMVRCREPYISHNALVSPQSVVVEAMATYTWICKKGLLLSKVICVQNTAESKKRSGFVAQNVMIYSLPQYTL